MTLDEYREAEKAREQELIAQWRKEGEEKSPFKRGQLVRVCQSPGMRYVSETKSWEGIPHNCEDPAEHWNSRVIGWDCFGRTTIATRDNNPHCGEWPYGDDCLTALPMDEDWAKDSKFAIGQRVEYVWELVGFWEADNFLGKRVPAILLCPHIDYLDWWVTYEKAEEPGFWIHRVLNERQMIIAK